MEKNTKIVVTIGPATESEEVIAELLNAGMNVARFNTKHSDPNWHNTVINKVRKVSRNLNIPVGILLDLQGPEIRIDLPNGVSFSVAEDETVTFSTKAETNQKTIIVPEAVIEGLTEGSHILIADGACEFEITAKHAHTVTGKAVMDCVVNTRKTMNTPGLVLPMPSLTERDMSYLEGVDLEMVDYVGLSFVRNIADINHLRQELKKKKANIDIIAKIEHQTALDNLDEIIEGADAVMVARGDLGVEVPYQELIYWQKMIIEKSRQLAKPVITATEMLKSMVTNPRPTRAEVSDVAHSIYDGTDAVMLSDETTVGKYPVKAVSIQATIAAFNEPFVRNEEFTFESGLPAAAISSSALQALEDPSLNISKIICLSEAGHTARILASYHPQVPIHVLTSREAMIGKLQLLYGVTAHVMEMPEDSTIIVDKVLDHCQKQHIVTSGETILIIHGTIWGKPGLTNSLSIVTIP